MFNRLQLARYVFFFSLTFTRSLSLFIRNNVAKRFACAPTQCIWYIFAVNDSSLREQRKLSCGHSCRCSGHRLWTLLRENYFGPFEAPCWTLFTKEVVHVFDSTGKILRGDCACPWQRQQNCSLCVPLGLIEPAFDHCWERNISEFLRLHVLSRLLNNLRMSLTAKRGHRIWRASNGCVYISAIASCACCAFVVIVGHGWHER